MTQPKSSGSGYLHCPHKGCKIWDENLNGVYFSTETLYARKWAFESAQTFAEFCHFVKLIQLVQQQLKLDFFFSFFGSYFRRNLISLYFLKTFNPLSKILLLVGKCNPHDSAYTVIFLFVGKVGCQRTGGWF